MKSDKKIALSPFEKTFLEHCKKKNIIEQGDSILLAVSGGADSVALFRLLLIAQPYLKFSFAVAHCNFQLRGNESNDDERFCARLCKRFGIKIFSVRFDTTKLVGFEKRSLEDSARQLRYNWFESLSRQHGFTKLATAHHANDNAETILFNLFRGSSLLGLAGIPERRDKIIRPILHVTRDEILTYLAKKKQRFRTDSSNLQDDFDRNFIRLNVIPTIERRFKEKLLPNLSRLSETAREMQSFVDRHISSLMMQKGLSFENQSFTIASLQKLTPFEQKEIFKRALKQAAIEPSAQTLSRLVDLLKTQSGRKVVLSDRVEAVWKKSRLVFVTSLERSHQKKFISQ